MQVESNVYIFLQITIPHYIKAGRLGLFPLALLFTITYLLVAIVHLQQIYQLHLPHYFDLILISDICK